MNVLFWGSCLFFFAGVTMLVVAKFAWFQTSPENPRLIVEPESEAIAEQAVSRDWESSTVDLAYLQEFVQRYGRGVKRSGTLSGSVA